MSDPGIGESYLSDLGEWQAQSHPELSDRKPEELFEATFVDRYDRLHNDIWSRMIRTHGTLHTLRELTDFPFQYLYAPNGMEFWRLVIENFLDMTCVLLHGLLEDQTKNAHTIRWFKNEITRGPWRDQKKRDSYVQTLAQRKFDERMRDIAERVAEIRHNRIAHRTVDRPSGHSKMQIRGVRLDELQHLFDATHALFGALSFGSSYVTLAGDLMPGTVEGRPTPTCLEGVLDAVLRDSQLVNQPERRAQWWASDREYMDPHELQVMNDLRKRVGLPEA